MELEKTEILPTLKVEATRPSDIQFKKNIFCIIEDVKEIETTFGKKIIMECNDGKETFSIFLNAKSKNLLIDTLGKDTIVWKNQQIEIKKEVDEKFNKEMLVTYPDINNKK